MTQSKELQNEKLINDLYEKLHWYTFEASDEQFDAEEVDAIVQLLDVLEPMKEDPRFPPDPAAARERFDRRFGVEEDAAGEVDIVSEAETDGVKAGRKRGWKRKKFLIRLGVGVAACIVLMLSVNVGSYALKQKSFFEIVVEEVWRMKITVTGNEDALTAENENIIEFSSWHEVEDYLETDLLEPEYIPPNYVFDKITVTKSGARTALFALYSNNVSNTNLQIKVDIFEGKYSERALMNDKNWILLDNVDDIFGSKYYISEKYKCVRGIFTEENKIYILLCQESIEELKKIIESMKYR